MTPRQTAPHRLAWLLAFVGSASVALVCRVVYIQCVAPTTYLSAGEQPGKKLSIRGERGRILDRFYRQLVASYTTTTISADPDAIQKWAARPTGVKASQLSREELRALPRLRCLGHDIAAMLDLPSSQVLEKLTRSGRNVVLSARTDADRAERLRAHLVRTPGMTFTNAERREYIHGPLACAVLGYCNSEQAPVWGVELWYRQITQPRECAPDQLYDRSGRRILGTSTGSQPRPVPGHDLVLTVELGAQQVVETVLDECVANRHPKGANAIVMSPRDGAILAMASRPNYDPNILSQPPLGGVRVTDEQLQNRVVSRPMEPGSSFKILTLAAAIEYGVIDESTILYCGGKTIVGGKELGCWGKYRNQGHGAQTPAQVLANSCNLCAAQIATKLGRERFHEFLSRCGIGELPRAGFPGEKRGLLPKPDDMGVRDLANIGFGQSVSVTDLQLAAAISAIMNGGVYYQPHIARGYVNPVTGEHYEARPRQVRRVCSERTSEIMRRMTRQVVDSGTGRAVAIEGQAVGGKTATAQIPDPVHGGYLSGEYLMAFVAIAPVDRHPDFVILVSVERPETGEHGSDVAGPMARQIAQYLLQQPRLFPSADAPADVSRTSGAAELG